MSDMDLYDEWRDLLGKHLKDGSLPKRERKRFKELTSLVRKQGLLGEEDEDALGSLEGKSEEARGS
jgi:hypothetical protein